MRMLEQMVEDSSQANGRRVGSGEPENWSVTAAKRVESNLQGTVSL